MAALATETLDFVYRHPGCVRVGDRRAHYSDGFRRFVLDLVAKQPDVGVATVAEAIRVPVGTLQDWLRASSTEQPPTPMDHTTSAPLTEPTAPQDLGGLQIETVLAEWSRWQGAFSTFCDHLRAHCGILLGRTLIARILWAYGARRPRRRQGRSPDELALRGAFETFFPHAQWVGDGTLLPVTIVGRDGPELQVFNLELDVDAYSGAFVGAHVSVTEDSDAVVAAFRDAVAQTETSPLAILLDNKPSNHTDKVDQAIGDTLRIRATPFRPQNKAHVEGALGLLKPTFEGLELRVEGSSEEIAASYLRCLVTAVGRAINQRPRNDRGGRSRVDLLGDHPTAEDVERARRALEDRLRKQQRARQTLSARQNSVVRDTIAAALARFGLADPDDHFLTAIARYPLSAVVEGVAIYAGKRDAGTLPPTADARYLLGIVRHRAEALEATEIASALWDGRVAARDRLARRWQAQLEGLHDRHPEVSSRLDDCMAATLATSSELERHFWLQAAATTILSQPGDHRTTLYQRAARHVRSCFACPQRLRVNLLAALAALILPLV